MKENALDISQLSTKECVSCTKETPKLSSQQVSLYLQSLPNWQIRNGKLEREIKSKNFQDSLLLANNIGEIAQKQNHHPDLYISWGVLRISIFTHSIQALSENDFILAAKIETLLAQKLRNSQR